MSNVVSIFLGACLQESSKSSKRKAEETTYTDLQTIESNNKKRKVDVTAKRQEENKAIIRKLTKGIL